MPTTQDRVATIWTLLRRAYIQWRADHAPMMAAACSYYLLVTIAPLVLTILWVGGSLLEMPNVPQPDALAPVLAEGVETAFSLEELAQGYAQSLSGYGSVVAFGVALFGATIFLGQLMYALDTIFGMGDVRRRGWLLYLRRRLLAIVALFATILVVAATGVAYTLLNALIELAHRTFDTGVAIPSGLQSVLDLGPWLGLVALVILFALAFTFLTSRSIRFRDTLPGAALTAGLYALGQAVLGVYLGSSTLVTAWGAAGTLVAFVVWVYYTMQVILFGAEFTKVWVDRVEERPDAPTGIRAGGVG